MSWFILSYGTYLVLSIGNVITGAHFEIEYDDLQNHREEDLDFGAAPFSLLILGIEREDLGAAGYADAIMLMSVNPEKESTIILSLTRDMWVDFTGHGIYYNHLGFRYVVGGASAVVDTVQRVLNLPVDYVVVIDMIGFPLLIDEVGGITIDNHLEFSHGGYHFPIGQVDLHGSKALSYARMRLDDPDSDFGRQVRQRAVAEATLRNLAQPGIALLRHNEIISVLGDHVKTNLETADLTTIFRYYRDALVGDIELLQLRGTSRFVNDVYTHHVPDEIITEMSEVLREHLGLEE